MKYFINILLIALFLGLSSFTSIGEPVNTIKIIKAEDKKCTYLYQNIYFDLNEIKINKNSKKELFIILSYFRRYPALQIEIDIHNSFMGKEDLSQIRADIIKDFLVKYGAKEDNVLAIGFNTSKYINYCRYKKKCSSKQNNINRRIEIKILNPEILSEKDFIIVQK